MRQLGEHIMDREQIEKVIEAVAKNGYTPERKIYTDKTISLYYSYCKFTFNLKGDQLVVRVKIQLKDHTGFEQCDVDYLNSFTDDWYIYEQCINFEFKPKTEKELEEVMWYSIKSSQ